MNSVSKITGQNPRVLRIKIKKESSCSLMRKHLSGNEWYISLNERSDSTINS